MMKTSIFISLKIIIMKFSTLSFSFVAKFGALTFKAAKHYHKKSGNWWCSLNKSVIRMWRKMHQENWSLRISCMNWLLRNRIYFSEHQLCFDWKTGTGWMSLPFVSLSYSRVPPNGCLFLLWKRHSWVEKMDGSCDSDHFHRNRRSSKNANSKDSVSENMKRKD